MTRERIDGDAPASAPGRRAGSGSDDNPTVGNRVSSPVFIGRETELAELTDALQRASAGRAQGVLIAGDSGVGKTRLLREFRTTAVATDATWLVGECISAAAGELPFAPITGALRAFVADPGALEGIVEASPELARVLPGINPPAAAGSARDPSAGASPEEAEFARARLFEQFLSLLTDLGSDGPVVLVLEDLQWADSSTRDLLTYVLRNAGAHPLLVICSVRSDELHRRHPVRPFLTELRRLDSVEAIEIEPFTRSELEAQLDGILGTPPDPAVADRLFERSEGNAFFSEELLAAAVDDAPIPPTVSDALLLRIERLSESTRGLLRVAALAGRRVSHSLLEATADIPEPELTVALREAIEHQVLIQDVGDASYAFRHALLAESISADLLPGERTRLHLALAEALANDPGLAAKAPGGAAAELAHHWGAAHRLEDALAASVEAGAQAEARCAFAEAAGHYENALELWDRVEDAERRAGVDEPTVLLRAAENASLTGRAERAVALARSAVVGADVAEHPHAAATAHERLGNFLWLAGDSEGAIAAVRAAVELMPADPPSVERARVLAAEGKMLMLHGEPTRSQSRCEEAIAAARSTGARAEEGHALNTLGCDLMLSGQRREAIDRIDAAKQIAERCSRKDLGRAYGNLVEALDQDGRVADAVELGNEGVDALRPLGQGGWMAYVLGWVSSELVRLGRLDEAGEAVGMGLGTAIEGIDLATLHCVAAEVAIHRGAREEGRLAVERAEQAAGQTTDVMIRAMLLDRAALVALGCGDVDRAAALADQGIADEVEGGYLFYTGRTYTIGLCAHADRAERARALGESGAAAEAERAGAEMLARLERLLDADGWLGTPPPESLARGATARAEDSRLRAIPDPDAWDRAAATWEELGFPIELAYARWREAEATLAAGGSRSDAAGPLQQAARLAEDSGAASLAAEVAALARRARIDLGLAAESESAHPPEGEAERFGLTDRELDVLALIAAGRTNPEIGETLFISAKTASAHVSHILSKLEVRSRLDAATAAHRLGLVPTAGADPDAASQLDDRWAATDSHGTDR